MAKMSRIDVFIRLHPWQYNNVAQALTNKMPLDVAAHEFKLSIKTIKAIAMRLQIIPNTSQHLQCTPKSKHLTEPTESTS